MIIKKLAVPFINEKLLQQAEHCYIATAAISEEGFDFIRSRIPTKTKMDIVTGLEMPTSPGVLQRIWRNYQGRISLHIYTRNRFHANLYIFDLPYRKSVAFVGSGDCTLGGLKDNDELFYRINDPKEIENLKSWYVGYYEFAQPLTEEIVSEYTLRHPLMKAHEHASRVEREQLLGLTAGFSWDHIKFRQQFFKKEDYFVFNSAKAGSDSDELRAERTQLQTKLLALHELMKDELAKLGLYAGRTQDELVSSIDPGQHPHGLLRSMSLTYGLHAESVKQQPAKNQAIVQVALGQKELCLQLIVGEARQSQTDREHFRTSMNDDAYRKKTLQLLRAVGPGYWIEVACDQTPVELITTEDALWEITKRDEWQHYRLAIGRCYAPHLPEISQENIAITIIRESTKLVSLVKHMIKQE